MEKTKPITAIVFLKENYDYTDKIYGLTVLERVFHALERGGISDIILSKKKEAIARHSIVKNDNWKVAFSYVDDFKKKITDSKNDLLLIQTPLVFDPKIVQQLIESGKESNTILISENGQIAYFPTGVQAKLEVLSVIEASSFSSWLQKAKQLDIPSQSVAFSNLVCRSIQSEGDKKLVKKELRRSLIKPTDGWVSKNLNRPISISISRVLAHTGITPNQFTVFTGFIGILTGVFMALGGYWYSLLGGALFHLTSILDGVDGELARLKFKSSPFGQWLDTVVDNLSYLSALAGLLIGIYRNGAPSIIIWGGILSVVFAFLALGSLYWYLVRSKRGGSLVNVQYSFQEGNSLFDRIMRVAAAFGKRDLYALIFFIFSIFGQLQMALLYVAIMAFLVFCFSIQSHLALGK